MLEAKQVHETAVEVAQNKKDMIRLGLDPRTFSALQINKC
jgi:hypothetical protein